MRDASVERRRIADYSLKSERCQDQPRLTHLSLTLVTHGSESVRCWPASRLRHDWTEARRRLAAIQAQRQECRISTKWRRVQTGASKFPPAPELQSGAKRQPPAPDEKESCPREPQSRCRPKDHPVDAHPARAAGARS